MKQLILTCILGLLHNLLAAQKLSAMELLDSLYKNPGIRSIWAIDGSESAKNRPAIIRIIDIKRYVFKKDSAIIDHRGGYGLYVVVQPKAEALVNLNTGKFREAFINTRPIRIPGKNEYLLRLIVYPYKCIDRFELSMYSVEVGLIKIDNRYKIKYIKCCGDAD